MTPVSVPPWLRAKIVRPLVVVWSVNVAPLAIVSVPEPGSLKPLLGLPLFRLIWTLVPLAVLVPPSCSVRPPSSPKPVKVNAAPPCAIVVPEPLCLPPEKLEAPVAVSVPVPLSSPLDCVKLATVAVLLPMPNVPPDRISGPCPT